MNGGERRDLSAQDWNRWGSERRRRRAAIVAAEGGIYVYVGGTFDERPHRLVSGI
jgi:hypothetical protein